MHSFCVGGLTRVAVAPAQQHLSSTLLKNLNSCWSYDENKSERFIWKTCIM